MKKTQIPMHKPAHLGLPKLELSRTFMYEFWYDYVKPKYREKAKLCYMDKDTFIVYIKRDDVYKDIAEDVETRFDTSEYDLDRLYSLKEKIKKIIELMEDELSGNIMEKFVGLRAKTYSYLIDDDGKEKKQNV